MNGVNITFEPCITHGILLVDKGNNSFLFEYDLNSWFVGFSMDFENRYFVLKILFLSFSLHFMGD